VARAPLLDALGDELDEALAALQTARRILAEMRRSQGSPGQGGGGPVHGKTGRSPGLAPSLRYSGWSVAQTAAALGIGEEQVRRLLRRGELAGVSFGGRVGWRLVPEYVQEVAALWRAAQAAQEAARAGTEPGPLR
jgi:hypothetical protein